MIRFLRFYNNTLLSLLLPALGRRRLCGLRPPIQILSADFQGGAGPTRLHGAGAHRVAALTQESLDTARRAKPAQAVGEQVAGGAAGAGDDDDAALVGGAREAVGGTVVCLVFFL
jgi:hypothetical protein